MTGKCSLCGSRLNNGKCEFCGLDSRMYDRKYMQDPYHMAEIAGEADTPTASPRQMQRSPGTSGRSGSTAQKTVFTANPPARKGAGTSSRRQKQDVSSWKKRQNSGTSRSRAVIVIVILVVLLGIAGPVLSQAVKSVIRSGSAPDADSWQAGIYSLFSDDDSAPDPDDDPYEYVTREIPEDGTAFEAALDSGIYQVGIHIPEGIYHVEPAGENGILDISDTENIIYDHIWFGDATEYNEIPEADDIRLYNGAEIKITGGGTLLFATDNAQPLTQETSANPLTESFLLEEGTFTAGEDIPGGIYDIILEEADEYISFGLDLSYPNGYSDYLWASNSSGEPEERIVNVIIPAGTELTLEGNPVQLVPGEGYFEGDISDYPWN